MQKQKHYFRKRRFLIFIQHGIYATIFISLYYFLDWGLMWVCLLIQLFVLIKDLQTCIYIEGDHLFYRTLFRTRVVAIQKIRRILLAKKTTVAGNGGYTVHFYYHVHIHTEDIRKSLLWEIPHSLIPKRERDEFTKCIQQVNPSASVNLVTEVNTHA